jgi:hypothetical protein
MVTQTKHEIDKITYIVESRSSENAVDTLHKKIEKLLIRDIRRSAVDSEPKAKNNLE